MIKEIFSFAKFLSLLSSRRLSVIEWCVNIVRISQNIDFLSIKAMERENTKMHFLTMA
jgi:hypothetical protein